MGQVEVGGHDDIHSEGHMECVLAGGREDSGGGGMWLDVGLVLGDKGMVGDDHRRQGCEEVVLEVE